MSSGAVSETGPIDTPQTPAAQSACSRCRRNKIRCVRDADEASCLRCLQTGSECAQSGGARPQTGPKQAACLRCHQRKVKCDREPNSGTCRRCEQSGADCVIPEFHIGRHKGAKNKHTGLEKAIHQVEQAIKRSKPNGGVLDADDLRQLVVPARSLLDGIEQHAIPYTSEGRLSDHYPTQSFASTQPASRQINNDRNVEEEILNPDELAVENADNPLQLLTAATNLPPQSPQIEALPVTLGATVQQSNLIAEAGDMRLRQYFGGLTPSFDNSQDLDPVELGLITVEESERFIQYFYTNLSHTRWGLDPVLHTPSFIRSRSAFLFTSMLAASAIFLPDAALAKRLSSHRDHLAQQVILKRYRSIEIVLAFMLNIPWMSPAAHWAQDDTCTYLSMALTIALDLQLNKIVVPSSTIRSRDFLEQISKSDCIEASKALRMDGFPTLVPDSIWGRRLLRTRERVWLALFVLDRGVCLARGRPFVVPTGPLVDSCDTWHISEVADQQDGSIISTAVLRRDMTSLITSLRDVCNSDTQRFSGGSTATVRYLKDKIDNFFDHWHSIWSLQITQSDKQLPPYVAILLSHTKLSTYCSVINHPTPSSEIKQFFRAAGLASAIDVMRAAVNGETRLKSMPNNTAIMITFAACFAGALSTAQHNGRRSLAPNVRSLIQQTAQVLENIGNVTKHRNGASALFARHIRRTMQSQLSPDPSSQGTQRSQPGIASGAIQQDASLTALELGSNASTSHHEQYSFDMTDEQIMEAINEASESQELFQLDESMFQDWLEWPTAT